MNHFNITRFSFDYKAGDFIRDINGEYVYRPDHEKSVAEILSKSNKEELHIPSPHPVARCKGRDGRVVPGILPSEIEQTAQLKSLFLTYEEHSNIFSYLHDQHKPKRGGVKRYNLYRFGPDKYKMMEMSEGDWIYRKEHMQIIDNLYQNFDLSKMHFPSIDCYGIMTNGENSWSLDFIEREDEHLYSESEREWARYEDHQSIIVNLERNLIK